LLLCVADAMALKRHSVATRHGEMNIGNFLIG
jgi:hypothetical protein